MRKLVLSVAGLVAVGMVLLVLSLRDEQRSRRGAVTSTEAARDVAATRSAATWRSVTQPVATFSPAVAARHPPANPPLPILTLPSAPDLQLDRDPDMGTPRFVRRRSKYLSPPAPGTDPQALATAFIEANGRAFTLAPTDIEPPNARVTRDLVTRHNGMRSLTWQQEHGGLDIYGAVFMLNLTAENRIINVSSRALHIPSVRFHDVVKVTKADALRIAGEKINVQHPTSNIQRPTREVWYPLDMISVVKAWDLIVSAPPTPDPRPSLHRLIIRADSGEVVEDIDLTWGLEAATFDVYTDDSPEPATPGADTPTNGVPVEVPRTNVTLIAIDTNASPQGWIPDGQNTLLGNNAHVYADWDDNDSPDGPAVTGTAYRVFDYPLDLHSGARSDYVEAAQVQAFYVINHLHDRLWQLGFDEPAGNFQGNNFGRGGLGADKLIVEVQNDYTAREGGVYGISAWYVGYGDGSAGRIGINTSTMPPRKDGALDAQVLIHEAAHGLSTRLIGNGFGLTTTQSRGLAEGWSDFLPLALLSEASDPPQGTYPFGSYVGERFMQPQHLYFGIRRFPYCILTNKAPQTVADIDPNQIAFPPDVPMDDYYASEEADQIHNIGEIWCLMLWECRANLIEEQGFAGNETMLQLVVDGMKLTPVNPTFIEARDAVLQADLVDYAGTNQIALWQGFAKRGLGYSAWVPGSVTTVAIVEGYDLPFTVAMEVTESAGDGDGYVEPGETGTMTVSLTSHEMALTKTTAVLTALSSNVTVTVSNATLPAVDVGGSSTSAPPFVFTVGGAFPGNADAQFSLRIESDKGWFENPLAVRIGNPYDYPPEITDIAVTNVGETSAWVSWRTGIPSQGYVEYGATTNYGASTATGTTWETEHIAQLTGLLRGTVYHYRIGAQGTNGLDALSGDYTLRTRDRVYVSASSTATQELGTIEAPFRSLQTAAEAAKTTGDDILVAMGTYTSAQTEAVLDLDGSEYDLTIEGGYSPDFSLRDADLFVTTIDGQRARRGIRLDNGAKLSISGVTITRGQDQWGGGVHVRKSVFEAGGCLIEGNASTSGVNRLGGGLFCTLASDVELEDCSVRSNVARVGGGLFTVSGGTSLRMINCSVTGNHALDVSGGVECELGADVALVCCGLSRNSTRYAAGGMSVGPFCSAEVQLSTVAANSVSEVLDPSEGGGGGIAVAGSDLGPASLILSHVLVYGNFAFAGADLWQRDYGRDYADLHVVHSDIGDIYGTLTTSNHIISVDPLFANPRAGDFHILYGSPCIDAGMTNYGGGSVDMDGEPRPFGLALDIGADEFTDIDDDHMADYWEKTAFGSITNSNGTADSDADELDDFGEYMNQTDPHDADTDDDLAKDGWEVANGYDPLDQDMDGDGMWDGWEANHALNAFTNDAALNPDSDAHDNLGEFAADTDPHDSNSVLHVLYIGEQWGGTRIDWQGGVDSWQFLEMKHELRATNGWTAIYGILPPTPITNAVVIFGETNSPVFYRIRAGR